MNDDEKTKIIEELQKIANDNDVLILSFVAPDRKVRISPISAAGASIDIDDLYEIEKVIEQLEEENCLPKHLHLVIQSPGGYVHITTKIANYLRKAFSFIHVFVPYEASSGGTVLCLAGNKITMGKLANLTPIDPQTPYNGQMVSAASYQQVMNDFAEKFGKMQPGEIPPPYQQMCSQLDPIILSEMNKLSMDTMSVAFSLLKKSYPLPENIGEDEYNLKLFRIAASLANSDRPHAHMIDSDEAELLGLVIDSEKKSINLLKTYKKWISLMLREEKSSHIIKHFKPIKTKKIKEVSDGKSSV